MKLSNLIRQYYYENAHLLPKEKQFHLASRMAAWRDDQKANELLINLKSYMVSGPDNGDLGSVLGSLINSSPTSKNKSYDLRQPFLKKYPLLYGLHSALFRVRHLKYVYQLDASTELFKHVSDARLDQLASELEADSEALRNLSTLAVNYLCLYSILADRPLPETRLFIKAARQYDLKNPIHIQFMIYLFTHCIIGDSNFYVRRVSSARSEEYLEMLKKLEGIIDDNFEKIKLDNKLEYLVCCRICGYNSKLFSRIHNECEESVSSEGHFLVDRHNLNASSGMTTFESSEHRNVLYIMSCSAYKPHLTLVQ